MPGVHRVCAAQKTVAEDGHEIAMVLELLKLLVFKNCIVSTDAANNQAQNTQTILEQSGDEALGLKENQATLHENMVLAFDHEDKNNFRGVEHKTWTTRETVHVQKETREYTLLSEPDVIEHFNPSGRWWRLTGSKAGRTGRWTQSSEKISPAIGLDANRPTSLSCGASC
ncbi:MAG: ISAs1 family transposase [Thermoflexales bacterium]